MAEANGEASFGSSIAGENHDDECAWLELPASVQVDSSDDRFDFNGDSVNVNGVRLSSSDEPSTSEAVLISRELQLDSTEVNVTFVILQNGSLWLSITRDGNHEEFHPCSADT